MKNRPGFLFSILLLCSSMLPHPAFSIEIDGMIDSFLEDRRDFLGPDGSTEHYRGVGRTVRSSMRNE